MKNLKELTGGGIVISMISMCVSINLMSCKGEENIAEKVPPRPTKLSILP